MSMRCDADTGQRYSRAVRCSDERPSASARWPWPRCSAEERQRRAAANPLAPRPPHFPARAKRVIFLFMKGGPSHVDTFDHKPLLERDHGKPLPFAKPRVSSRQTGNLLGSPWKFKQHGESGHRVSELFPHVAGCVDDLCFIHSMHGTNPAHGGRLLKLHTGSDNFVRPSMGSWITYGLGTENAGPAGLHHHLPDPGPRRRQQLGLGLPARRLPGHAARQRQRARPTRPGSASSATRDCRATCSDCSSTCWPR